MNVVKLHRAGYPTIISRDVMKLLHDRTLYRVDSPSRIRHAIAELFHNIGQGNGYANGDIYKEKAGQARLQEVFNQEIEAFILRRVDDDLEIRPILQGLFYENGLDAVWNRKKRRFHVFLDDDWVGQVNVESETEVSVWPLDIPGGISKGIWAEKHCRIDLHHPSSFQKIISILNPRAKIQQT